MFCLIVYVSSFSSRAENVSPSCSSHLKFDGVEVSNCGRLLRLGTWWLSLSLSLQLVSIVHVGQINCIHAGSIDSYCCILFIRLIFAASASTLRISIRKTIGTAFSCFFARAVVTTPTTIAPAAQRHSNLSPKSR